jgi:signal transduction histidine kinase
MTTNQDPPAPASAADGPKRHFKNMLLQPLLQIKLGIYAISLSAITALILVVLMYVSLSSTFDLIMELTDARTEVEAILSNMLWEAISIASGVMIGYVIIMVCITIWYTHRLVGPTVAFRRHINMLGRGQFYARTNLRKGDAFFEVADELNRLSDILQSQAKPPPNG